MKLMRYLNEEYRAFNSKWLNYNRSIFPEIYFIQLQPNMCEISALLGNNFRVILRQVLPLSDLIYSFKINFILEDK